MFNRVCDPVATLIIHLPATYFRACSCTVTLECWMFAEQYKQKLMMTKSVEQLLNQHVDIFGISWDQIDTQQN